METARPVPPNLATRLHLAGVDARVAAVLAAAVAEDLGVDALRLQDPDAADRLTQILEAPARQAATGAVNKLAFETLALLDEVPDLRDRLGPVRPVLPQPQPQPQPQLQRA
ncbi:MAG: hypothetical protein ACP5VP_11995 [Candidatus Limnocylindrales bacterium]